MNVFATILEAAVGLAAATAVAMADPVPPSTTSTTVTMVTTTSSTMVVLEDGFTGLPVVSDTVPPVELDEDLRLFHCTDPRAPEARFVVPAHELADPDGDLAAGRCVDVSPAVPGPVEAIPGPGTTVP